MRIYIRGAPCDATTVCGPVPLYCTRMSITDGSAIIVVCSYGGTCSGNSFAE